jgi:hypothetical protein
MRLQKTCRNSIPFTHPIPEKSEIEGMTPKTPSSGKGDL